MIKIAKYLVATLALIGAIDFFGFIAWAVSGQLPPDDFFVGTITWHLINNFWSVYPYLLIAWIFLAPVACAMLVYWYARRDVVVAEKRMRNRLENTVTYISNDMEILTNSIRAIEKDRKPARKLRVKSKRA